MTAYATEFHDGPCEYTYREDWQGAPGMWGEYGQWACIHCGEPTPDGSEPTEQLKWSEY